MIEGIDASKALIRSRGWRSRMPLSGIIAIMGIGVETEMEMEMEMEMRIDMGLEIIPFDESLTGGSW